jgi:hypothetical protein
MFLVMDVGQPPLLQGREEGARVLANKTPR